MRDPQTEAILQEETGYAVRDNNPMSPTSIEGYPQVAGIIPAGLLRKGTSEIVDTVSKRRKSEGEGPSPEDVQRLLDVAQEPAVTTPLGDEAPATGLDMPEEGVTDDVLKQYQEGETPDPIADKRTDERNINIQRHHEGGIANPALDEMPPEVALEKMKSADDIAKLLDAVASTEPASGVRRNVELEEATQDITQVKEILAKRFGADPEQMGLMNDKQLLASRKMLSTLGESVVELANKITDGDKTPRTLLEYQQKAEAFVALQRYTQGQVKEVARALQQQNMIAGSLSTNSVESIMDMIQGSAGRTPEDIARQAANVAKRVANDPENGLATAFKPDWRDYVKVATEFWTNNILSGVSTHVVNTAGNTSVQVWEGLVLKPLAAAIGETRKGLGITWGGKDRNDYVSGKEALVNIWAGSAGVRDGIRVLAKTLATGESKFGPEKGEEIRGSMKKVFGYHGQQVGGETGRKVGEAVADASTLAFRLLQAEDDLFKTVSFRMELTALAVRDGLKTGKTGEALDQHVKQVMDNPPDDIYEAAMAKSREVTFTETEQKGLMGTLTRGVKTAVSEQPYLKFIMPFVNTPANLLAYGINSSALAAVNPKLVKQLKAGGAQADIALAKMTAGIALSVAVYKAYEAGALTGNGPEDYKLRKVLERQGWQANSIRIGDKYYSYKRIDPFAMGIAGLVDQMDKAKYARTEIAFQEHFMQGSMGVVQHALDATFMRGANDLLNVIDDPSKVNSWAANYATGFIPYSGAFKTASKLNDPQPRRVSDDKKYETGLGRQVSQKMKQVIPGQSRDLRPARYWDGTLVSPDGGAVAYAVSPYKTDTLKPDPASKQLFENAVAPAEPSAVVRYAGVEFSLLSLDDGQGKIYDAYVEYVGKARKKGVDSAIKDSDYKVAESGPESERSRLLSNAISKTSTASRWGFISEELPKILKESPELATKLTELIGTDFESFLKMARLNKLPPELDDKVRVKGEDDIGALPNPESRQQKMPRF